MLRRIDWHTVTDVFKNSGAFVDCLNLNMKSKLRSSETLTTFYNSTGRIIQWDLNLHSHVVFQTRRLFSFLLGFVIGDILVRLTAAVSSFVRRTLGVRGRHKYLKTFLVLPPSFALFDTFRHWVCVIHEPKKIISMQCIRQLLRT